MKKAVFFRLWLPTLAVLTLTLSSCDNDNDHWQTNTTTALVTVRPTQEGSFNMQLDNNTTLVASNLTSSPYGDKEVRAIVNYIDEGDNRGDIRSVRINWMDSIRTKLPVPYIEEQNDRLYGNDPIEIMRDWVTVAEDGYLTLRIRTLWGDRNVKHHVNLLTGKNADDAFEVELRHNAMGDVRGHVGDALIAFNLNQLPRNGQDAVKLKVHWTSFSGPKSAEFDLQLHPSPSINPTERMPLNSRIE